jgi:hypothetical protein
MQPFLVIRRFMQQPLLVVLGVLTGAGAAKSGHGAWAAGAILTFLSIYYGAVVTFMMSRSLAAWVARMRRYEAYSAASATWPLAAKKIAPRDMSSLGSE